MKLMFLEKKELHKKLKNWTREETMLAFELYCIIPKGKDTIHNEEIITLAKIINRTVNSVKLKLQNFKSYDPSYTKEGKVGLNHGSKLDEEVCNAFFQNWDDLIFETNNIKERLGIAKLDNKEQNNIEIPLAKEKNVLRKERIGQYFFRQALLAAYNNKCCFTGLSITELLRASHIKPWAVSNNFNEKTNPRNGLLLNALHDVAFDKGFITISLDYKIIVSKRLILASKNNKKYFDLLHGKKISLPNRFIPDLQFIEYHNKFIFKD